MTTPARSWAELVETLRGGIAVIDTNHRFVFVGDGFLPALGKPSQLIGNAVQHVIQALAEDDPRRLLAHLDAGERIEFEQQLVTAAGGKKWYRVTIAPASELGGDLAAVVFAIDISATSRRLNRLRHTMAELTEVENKRRRNVSRAVHDGPIQLMAALVFRLGMSKTDEAAELQRSVSDVSSTLREVIEEFAPTIEQTWSERLESWIDPILIGTAIDVHIQDQRTQPSGLAEAQAAFVLIYQAIRAIREPGSARTLSVRLTDEDGGERVIVTVPSGPPATFIGQRATRFRTAVHHAHALGGTLVQDLDENNLRTFSMWIPKLADPAPMRLPDHEPPTQLHQLAQDNDLASLPPLSDAAWCQIVEQAPGGMIELDDKMRVWFASTALPEMAGISGGDLVGVSSTSILEVGAIDDLESILERLKTGEFVESHWRRTDVANNPRLVHLTMSPRLSNDRRWEGLLIAAEDVTDIVLLDELYQSALTDLNLTRHLAVEASIRRLEQPLARCASLIDQIQQFEYGSSASDAVREIRLALSAALESVESSDSALSPLPSSIGELGLALDRSLGTLLFGRQLVVVDQTESALPTGAFEIMFLVAREAITNAVIHGKAETITISLSNHNSGIRSIIHDDGRGVTTSELQHQSGHLGIRAMKARALEHGGTCSVDPHPVVGTVVSLWLPVDTNQPTIADDLAR